MATSVSNTALQTPTPQPRTLPRQQRAESRGEDQATIEARRSGESGRSEQTKRAEARPEARADRAERQDRPADRVQVDRSNPREQGREVVTRGEQVSRLQAAGQAVDGGIEDLRRLSQVAQQAEEEPTQAGRDRLQSEADSLGQRIGAADGDQNVEQARQALQQTSREREASSARAEADRAGRRAEDAQGQPERSTPTLVLEPRRDDAEDAADAAQAADDESREAERRAEAGAAENQRGERGGAAEAFARTRESQGEEQATRAEQNSSIRPSTTDVSTPERAAETRRAAGEAEGRATELRREIGQSEKEESQRAEQALREQQTSSRRVSNEAESREAADRVVQDARRNPRQFVEAQARVTTEAATRLLA
jgi:hypothetical protein